MVGLELSGMELLSKLESIVGDEYSKDQRDAILHGEGPLWITAGPGSGKTEVLVARTLKLLISDKVPPASIFLATFTEKAADNLVNRIGTYIDELGYLEQVAASELRSGTLHSLCDALMREHRYPEYVDLELLDEDSRMFFLYNQEKIIEYFQSHWKHFRPIFKGFRVSEEFGPNRWTAASAASFMLDRITEFRVDINSMASGGTVAKTLAETYQLYRNSLRSNYRCDFAILQEYFLRFLDSPHGNEFLHGDPKRQREPIRHILVDEFQDTNPIQEDIYFRIAKDSPHNITVVGDDDQALYRFRGGTVDSLVSFGDRCSREWKTSPLVVNLNENRRSHPGIVNWINDYISKAPAMRKKGVRALGKRLMIPRSRVRGDYPPVCGILERTLEDAGETLAEFIISLKTNRLISDWRDVAILLRSTRESPRNAKPFVVPLRSREVPVYNPRNRALHEDPRIQEILGALIATLDKNLKTLKSVRGGVTNEVSQWVQAYQRLASSSEGREIREYVNRANSFIDQLDAGKYLNITVMDVLYRILSIRPFKDLKEDPNYTARFALITSLIDSFTAFTERYGLLRSSSTASGQLSFSFLRTLYYQFSGYIEAYGLNEPEDPENKIPAGFVQVMTVHQAKGLEFPVVIVGSLQDKPEVGGDNWTEDFLAPWSARKPIGSAQDRAEQDLIRRFYVAFSRAKNLVILCGKEGGTSPYALGDWNGN
jgi:DNA helicase II / ATP-dependent DNA helicase PcrA